MTASALYEGTVRHRRFAVRGHAFTHRIALVYIDLDELPTLLGGRLVARRPGLVRFRRRDYLGDPRLPLAEAVRVLVAQRTGRRPDGAVRVLTQLRTLGHCFNPVSFYYCHDAGDALQAIVAEITSTPWGERHAYVLPAGERVVVQGMLAKRLHVSPFMSCEQRYAWRATRPGPGRPTLSVHIESHEAGAKAFDATLALRRGPLTGATLARATVRHAVPSLRVLALIYVHAAVLWLKRVPIHPPPIPPEVP